MKDLNALGRILRGFSVSAAIEETYSGPRILPKESEADKAYMFSMVTYVNVAWMMQEITPQKRPVLPSTRCSAKAPFSD
jgi:hypothetical protein